MFDFVIANIKVIINTCKALLFLYRNQTLFLNKSNNLYLNHTKNKIKNIIIALSVWTNSFYCSGKRKAPENCCVKKTFNFQRKSRK